MAYKRKRYSRYKPRKKARRSYKRKSYRSRYSKTKLQRSRFFSQPGLSKQPFSSRYHNQFHDKSYRAPASYADYAGAGVAGLAGLAALYAAYQGYRGVKEIVNPYTQEQIDSYKKAEEVQNDNLNFHLNPDLLQFYNARHDKQAAFQRLPDAQKFKKAAQKLMPPVNPRKISGRQQYLQEIANAQIAQEQARQRQDAMNRLLSSPPKKPPRPPRDEL